MPLKSNRDRFCPLHADLEAICAIVDCNQWVVQGLLTCSNPEHQSVESLHQEKGQSRFQLHDHLQRARVAYPTSHSTNTGALSQLTVADNDEEIFAVDPSGRVTSHDEPEAHQPTSTPHKKIRAKFTRSRTHNEQLAVAPCGMILGRDTMFGAEGVASVAVSPNSL